MVTYFNQKDLIEFGQYLLSSERQDRIIRSFQAELDAKNEGTLNEPVPAEERLGRVHHADIDNWLYTKATKA